MVKLLPKNTKGEIFIPFSPFVPSSSFSHLISSSEEAQAAAVCAIANRQMIRHTNNKVVCARDEMEMDGD